MRTFSPVVILLRWVYVPSQRLYSEKDRFMFSCGLYSTESKRIPLSVETMLTLVIFLRKESTPIKVEVQVDNPLPSQNDESNQARPRGILPFSRLSVPISTAQSVKRALRV